MNAHTPEEVHQLWAERFSAENLEGLMALYEPNAALVPTPGQVLIGHAAIREALSGFLALHGHFEMHLLQAIQTGDIAILYSQWTLNGTGPDGSAVAMSGQTSDVVRRQTDGTWTMVIDNPFGN